MIRIITCWCVAALAAGAVLPPIASGQELRVFSVVASSSQTTLSQPIGFGFSGVIAPSSWIRVEGGFTTLGQDQNRTALVCASYIPRGNCRVEDLAESYLVRSFRLAYAPMVLEKTRYSLAVKAGLSISQIVSTSKPESGRASNLQHPRTGQDGRYVGLQASFTPVARVPLSINLAGVSQWIDFTGCQEYDFQFAPFCGTDRFDEFQVGMAFLIGR